MAQLRSVGPCRLPALGHGQINICKAAPAAPHPVHACMLAPLLCSPGSVMASTLTRKYLPQAVPRSTLSGGSQGQDGGGHALISVSDA